MTAADVAARNRFARTLEPEILDRLAREDPRAVRARSDLRRINWLMGSLAIVLGALDRAVGNEPPRSLLELGAGDGWLMNRIARKRARKWGDVTVTLLDREPAIGADVLLPLCARGWTPRIAVADVFEALARAGDRPVDVVLANLFVHHFSESEISRMFARIARRARAFVCVEPRRSTLALGASRLVGLVGAGPVARFDAVASVRAGFRADELSRLWPPSSPSSGWMLTERRAGLFSHCFTAVRTSPR